MTSGSHGKPYATWALPGAACVHAIRPDGKSAVDAVVLDSVVTRLTDTLAWLFPAQRRTSDEHVSSGDETSSSEDSEENWRSDVVMVVRGGQS